MTAHNINTLTRIEGLVAKLTDGIPELGRRAAIPSRRDGYPPRGSGSQPGNSASSPTYVVSVTRDTAITWAWSCSCSGDVWVGGHSTPTTATAAGITHVDQVHAGTVIDYADPTGETVIGTERPDDPVTARWRRAVAAIERAERALQAAAAQLVDPTDTDEGGPWCASCLRIKHLDGRPYLSPPDARVKGATDVNARLTAPMVLCRWCRDHVASQGGLPERSILTEYLAKGRAPRRAA